MSELPLNFEKGGNFNIEEILREAAKKTSEKKVCKSLYHFLIIEDYVVTDLPKTRPITCIQHYINGLLLFPKGLCFAMNPVIGSGKVLMSQLKTSHLQRLPMPTKEKSAIGARVGSLGTFL